MRLLSNLLTKFVQNGTLRLVAADGESHLFGGKRPGPVVTIRLHDPALHRKLFLNPELHAGEAYMNGTLTFEDGSNVGDFMYLFSLNRAGLGGHASQKLLRSVWRGLKRWHQANPIGVAAANARHHYDISTDLYRLFLDDGLNYSCAFFSDPEHDTLEDAQRNKLARITAKLRLQPGMTVAEIGSGWGSLAIHIAASTGVHVVAINVSPEQIGIARERAAEAGVADRVEFRELDYRALEGRFDRVVSVGMMEHVGIGNFDAYFSKIRDLLTDDGYAFVHCIGRMLPPGTTGPFIRKYIFPGAYVPSLSEVFASTERTALWVADMEVLRLHYYHTLRHWRARFAAHRDRAAALYDERFCRMWEYYLAAVEVGFLNGSNMVFQLLLSTRRDAVPIVRDFMLADAHAR
ncbi:SAM-dependent methyltransferase [Limobrevibacterium gyesilva]|uniref:Cyclopropane-fatty-acyl-phospholipid synthase family protein n=1 Tax=Limobrevibacterium gyesilva TaxID=2991712 RepID=A0AA41YLS3_9PROT|nr:cyclopropane-fatty-acyl-phospholipid synthase family protein [Limobrevibacterium gyesilva]MCW3476196.1 cyclopropane-fatty-acyl-phospholipid synthase family protein [Limobrevibacterium gyesilva]